MTDHRALVTALAAADDYPAAADAHALYLYDEWQRHELMFNTAAMADKRESWRQSAISAQATYTNWLVAIDKNLRAEVDGLVARWEREAA